MNKGSKSMKKSILLFLFTACTTTIYSQEWSSSLQIGSVITAVGNNKSFSTSTGGRGGNSSKSYSEVKNKIGFSIASLNETQYQNKVFVQYALGLKLLNFSHVGYRRLFVAGRTINSFESTIEQHLIEVAINTKLGYHFSKLKIAIGIYADLAVLNLGNKDITHSTFYEFPDGINFFDYQAIVPARVIESSEAAPKIGQGGALLFASYPIKDRLEIAVQFQKDFSKSFNSGNINTLELLLIKKIGKPNQ